MALNMGRPGIPSLKLARSTIGWAKHFVNINTYFIIFYSFRKKRKHDLLSDTFCASTTPTRTVLKAPSRVRPTRHLATRLTAQTTASVLSAAKVCSKQYVGETGEESITTALLYRPKKNQGARRETF